MSWTNETSSPEDLALDRAWDALNQALDRRVPVSIQMRVAACVADILSFVTVVRTLEAEELQRSVALDTGIDAWLRSDKSRAPTATWDSHLSFQFAAAVKAIYYFIRALQDAVYAALLEATGKRAGRHSSMYLCAKNPSNPMRRLINEAMPEYFAWFADLRAIRNQMKLGASTAFGRRGAGRAMQVHVILQDIDDAERHVSQGRELSLVDIDTCLVQSARLLQWSAGCITTAA